MKALALKSGRRTIEVSRRGPGYLWAIALSHMTGIPYWRGRTISAEDKKMMLAHGWRIVPVEFEERK